MAISKSMHYKYWLLIMTVFCAVLMASCESSYKEIIYFDGATFSVSGIEATDTTLVVTGSIKNGCNYSYETPWFLGYNINPVQGASNQVLAGQIEMTSPLECDATVEWEARYEMAIFTNQGSTTFEVNDFEAFYILD